VHGLTGDRERTWRVEGADGPWPAELLPPEFPNARLLTFGYDAYVANLRGMVSVNKIANHAMNLLTSVAAFRDRDDTVLFTRRYYKDHANLQQSLTGQSFSSATA
jgi:protein SERAC1